MPELRFVLTRAEKPTAALLLNHLRASEGAMPAHSIAQLKSMVEKQEAANVQQQKQIEAVTAGLQKVRAQG